MGVTARALPVDSIISSAVGIAQIFRRRFAAVIIHSEPPPETVPVVGGEFLVSRVLYFPAESASAGA